MVLYYVCYSIYYLGKSYITTRFFNIMYEIIDSKIYYYFHPINRNALNCRLTKGVTDKKVLNRYSLMHNIIGTI